MTMMNLQQQLNNDRDVLVLRAERERDSDSLPWIERAKGFVDASLALTDLARSEHAGLTTADLSDLHFVERWAADCRSRRPESAQLIDAYLSNLPGYRRDSGGSQALMTREKHSYIHMQLPSAHPRAGQEMSASLGGLALASSESGGRIVVVDVGAANSKTIRDLRDQLRPDHTLPATLPVEVAPPSLNPFDSKI